MNVLYEDLKNGMIPEYQYVYSDDFENEAAMQAYIKKHPASKNTIKIAVVDGTGATRWKAARPGKEENE